MSTPLEKIGYGQWQAMVRLPYLLLMALRFDQRGEIHPRQVACFVDYFRHLGGQTGDRFIEQWAADVITDAQSLLQEARGLRESELVGVAAVGVEGARRCLGDESFRALIHHCAELAARLAGALPWWVRMLARWRGSRRAAARAALARLLEEAL